MTAVMSADHVVKEFRTRGRSATRALDDVSLDVIDGEFLVLLGASGCGKTTLLRLLSGLEPPTSGAVSVFGDQLKGPNPKAALVFQNPVLLPWRTILQNVLLPGEIKRKSRSQLQERALELLAMTGLSGFENHYPRELSGGMRQRAAICRALLLDPPILFMDEPFGALDAITRMRMNEELYDLWQQTGKTIVFVTHDITEAVRLGSRVIVMTPRPGRIAHVTPIPIEEQTYAERISSDTFFQYLRVLEDQVSESIGAVDAVAFKRGELRKRQAESTQNVSF